MKGSNNNNPLKLPMYTVWAQTIKLMRVLREEDGLLYYDLALISAVQQLNDLKLLPITRRELYNSFQIIAFKFDTLLQKNIERGYLINNKDPLSKRGIYEPYKLSVSKKGELLLKKYEKVLYGLIEGK